MSAELVPVADRGTIEQLDSTQRGAAVTAYLAHARDQLSLAIEMTGPAAIAALKAEIATAAEATKQLGLSKEIQADAQEMVRRAEYALGKAIRAGQEAGEIASKANPGGGPTGAYVRVLNGVEQLVQPVVQQSDNRLASPLDYATRGELSGSGREPDGIYHMVDDVSEPEFETALSDARAEGNLSRANVVRKIQGVKSEGLTPVEKLAKIRELAPRGYTSGQIAAEIGCTESYVRERAREHSIEITADKVMARTHRVKVDHDHIVTHLVMTLDGLAAGLDVVDVESLDEAQMQNWADSLTHSLRALNRFAKQIKEKTQ